eukprot:1737082-Rhodomonas_salina.1
MHCPVLVVYSAIGLRASYATPGTDSRPTRPLVSGTDSADGTELAYGATSECRGGGGGRRRRWRRSRSRSRTARRDRARGEGGRKREGKAGGGGGSRG